VLLHFLDRWLEERETSELQAQRLAQVREEAKNSRTLNDNAMQVLFAASTLIALLKSDQHELPTETAVQLEETAQALDRAVRQLRAHLTG
jgi:signal transduction histidine kinase